MPKRPKWVELWPDFEKALKAKLQAGHETYGDTSFDLRPDRLLEELSLEAIDLAGWGFILWARIEQLRRVAGKLD